MPRAGSTAWSSPISRRSPTTSASPANYTYADGKQTSAVPPGPGDDRLVGTSKNTYNVSGYFENKMFNARVAYTYRSAFYSGLDRSTAFTQDAIGTLSASLGYTMNDHFSITFDGMNLNNPDAQVLCVEPGSAARLLQERLAVLPELPLQAVGEHRPPHEAIK